mmetsp:Transcript_36273/g.90514  ORF Transcript_36273/g.90514 Transcript_36273/m.90514 type:complete len:235 (+) Transcript_36273:403-1107(+)
MIVLSAPSKIAKSLGTTASPSTASPSPHTCTYESAAYPARVPFASGPILPRTVRPVTHAYPTPAVEKCAPGHRSLTQLSAPRVGSFAPAGGEIWGEPSDTRRRTAGCGTGTLAIVAAPSSLEAPNTFFLDQSTSFNAPPMYARPSQPPAECATKSTRVAFSLAASARPTASSTNSRYQLYPGSVVLRPVQNPRLSTARSTFAQSLRSSVTTWTSHPRARSAEAMDASTLPKGAR